MSQFNSAFAGKAIADRNCKEFASYFMTFIKIAVEQTGDSRIKDKYYPVTVHHDKKENFFHDAGDLYFFQTKIVNNGFYGSFNSAGKLDAFIVEIDKNSPNAIDLVTNQFRYVLASLFLIDKNFDKLIPKLHEVVLKHGTYLDYYTSQNFYLRIQNIRARKGFYTIVASRPENFVDY